MDFLSFLNLPTLLFSLKCFCLWLCMTYILFHSGPCLMSFPQTQVFCKYLCHSHDLTLLHISLQYLLSLADIVFYSCLFIVFTTVQIKFWGQKYCVIKYFFPPKGHFFIAFRERDRQEGGEKRWCERETSIGCFLLCVPMGNQTCNLGLFPDWE